MDDDRSKSLRNYSINLFLFSVIIFFLGFLGISSANSVSYGSSTYIMTDIAYGISLVMIGCFVLLGSILFFVKAKEIG